MVEEHQCRQLSSNKFVFLGWVRPILGYVKIIRRCNWGLAAQTAMRKLWHHGEEENGDLEGQWLAALMVCGGISGITGRKMVIRRGSDLQLLRCGDRSGRERGRDDGRVGKPWNGVGCSARAGRDSLVCGKDRARAQPPWWVILSDGERRRHAFYGYEIFGIAYLLF